MSGLNFLLDLINFLYYINIVQNAYHHLYRC